MEERLTAKSAKESREGRTEEQGQEPRDPCGLSAVLTVKSLAGAGIQLGKGIIPSLDEKTRYESARRGPPHPCLLALGVRPLGAAVTPAANTGPP